MRINLFPVDAFARQVRTGIRAAVRPLGQRLADGLARALAAATNSAQSAFCAPSAEGFAARGFTAPAELDLCGPPAGRVRCQDAPGDARAHAKRWRPAGYGFPGPPPAPGGPPDAVTFLEAEAPL